MAAPQRRLLQVGRLLLILILLMDLGLCQQQDGGFRFPNLFGGNGNPFSGLSNLFRQVSRPQRDPPAPQQQLSPQVFHQQQQQPGQPIFFHNGAPSGIPGQPQFIQPQANAGFSGQHSLAPAVPITNSNGFIPNNGPQQQPQQVPSLVPIGNIPLQGQQQQLVPQSLPPPPPPPQHLQSQQLIPSQPVPQAPPLLPAQFALSSNTLLQHQQTRTGKSILTATKRPLSTASNEDVVDCGSGNDIGFCAVSEKYPRHVVDDMMHRCHDTVRVMYAEIPEDYESLGDSQPGPRSVNNSSASSTQPWSWSDYRKESACESELRFIQPQVAQDRLGRWRIIVQTSEFPQRVAIDVCRRVDEVCKVFTDCGRKSRCVQRYSYQPLISLDQDVKDPGQCPTMAVFRFPTSCVCHVEVDPVTARRRHS